MTDFDAELAERAELGRKADQWEWMAGEAAREAVVAAAGGPGVPAELTAELAAAGLVPQEWMSWLEHGGSMPGTPEALDDVLVELGQAFWAGVYRRVQAASGPPPGDPDPAR